MGSKISILVIVLVMVGLAGVLADAPTNDTDVLPDEEHQTFEETEQTKEDDMPKEFLFENYPLETQRYEGEIVPVNFGSNPFARNFEEIITRSVETIGVNFAGTYSIATWSCGSGCQQSAIVNVATGDIHTYGIISKHGLSFSPGSTLLIINPKDSVTGEIEGELETDYYRITDDTLVFEGKEIGDMGVREDCIQAIAHARNTITNEVLQFPTPCTVPFGWELVP